MMARKIEAMYQFFGRYTGKEFQQCKDCCNFIRKQYNHTYRKCLIYGDTDSEATDWKASYEACGMFNTEYAGNRIIDILKRSPKPKDNEPIKGQLTLFESR
jgi:hypothetical protein